MRPQGLPLIESNLYPVSGQDYIIAVWCNFFMHLQSSHYTAHGPKPLDFHISEPALQMCNLHFTKTTKRFY